MIENLRHIRAFLAVARIGNFTRAAAELHVSQSALTVQIQQLENGIGSALFDRGKRKITLTQAGKDALLPLERLLADAEAIIHRTQQLSGLERGVVSFAVLPSLATELAPKAIRRFTTTYPGIRVQVRDLVAEKVIEAVRLEEVDFGIATQMRPTRDIQISPFSSDHMCVFLPSDHPLAGNNSLTLAQVLGQPLVLTGRDSSVRELVESVSKRHASSLHVAYETNYMPTALGMVEAGLGVAILPAAAAGSHLSAGIRRVRIVRPKLSRKIQLIQRKGTALSAAATKLITLLRELASSKG